MLYRRKAGTVEAKLYDGLNLEALQAWGVNVSRRPLTTDIGIYIKKAGAYGTLRTGDWVVKEPDGEGFYPCTGREFARLYEPAVGGV